jgi:ADP-heptose:LPS heptosyltransferase
VLVGRTKRELPAPENCLNLLNHTSVLQLIWLIRRARFVISVDSGPMHIAAALTDRLVSIHSWSDPRKVGPYNQNAWVWKNGSLARIADLPAPSNPEKSRPFKLSDVGEVLEVVRPKL